MASRFDSQANQNMNSGIDVEPTATSPDVGTMSEVEPTAPFIDTSKMRPSDPNILYEDQVTDRERRSSAKPERIERSADGSVIIPEPRSFEDVVRDQANEQANHRAADQSIEQAQADRENIQDPTHFPIDE